MASPVAAANDMTFRLAKEVHVKAPLEVTFEALLVELGPEHQLGDEHPLPMTLEAWPGGRWFRDLGSNNGHWWGNVQAIKRPTLLEISGPLAMSTATISNIQYRLKAVDGGTLITFVHSMAGVILDGYREVETGWSYCHERIVRRAESMASQKAKR